MSKLRLISLLAMLLFIINLVLLYFYTNKRPDKQGPRNEIIERLHFDEAQITLYDDLIKGHRKAIGSKELEILNLKNMLYQPLANANEVNVNDSLLAELGRSQQAIEIIHYKHFQDIKHLCKSNQLAYFNELMKDIAQLFSHRRKKSAL